MSVVSRIAFRAKLAQWSLLRATRRTVTLQTKQGRLAVDTRDDIIAKLLFLDGHFQHDLTLRALPFLRQQGLLPERGHGVVLDIGANIGLISIGLLVNEEVAGAIGIEPAPENFVLLERNVRGNGVANRYAAIPVAASDRAGDLDFALSTDNFGDHRVQPRGKSTDRQVVSVPARPLNEILADLPASTVADISLVWIDVQGHEGYVFAGGSEIFSRDIPVVTELWPHGILQSGMTLEQFAANAQGYWASFWVWRRAGRFVRYPTTFLLKFFEELGEDGPAEDVIFTQA